MHIRVCASCRRLPGRLYGLDTCLTVRFSGLRIRRTRPEASHASDGPCAEVAASHPFEWVDLVRPTN